ncbi:MAG: hypothetical protein WCJ56_10945, partial [bacterium]
MRIWFLGALVLALGLGVWAQGGYEAGFQSRSEFIIKKLAEQDPVEIMNWANRVKLGDPHKYALGPIIARLDFDPKDEKALTAYRMLMEVDKGKADRGLYHFSAYLRLRMFLQFRNTLPKDIIDSNIYDVTNFFRILRSGGTENQAFMSRTSGYMWTELVPGPYPGDKQQDNQKWFVDWLRAQSQKFYNAGMGEYDSSTYTAFDAAAFSNIYDYSKDPNMRALAQADMDWVAAAQAIKYFHGVNIGPEARGFASSSVNSITDWMNWLWFDDSARPITDAEPAANVGKHAVINLALSGYRPPQVIRNIANKNIPLPFQARASKPSYYGSTPNKDQEYLYFSKQYAMSTLYSPETGIETKGTILPQTTMFKAVLLDKDNTRVFGMSNGYHQPNPAEGRTPYDQYHQQGSAALDVTYVNRPEDERTKNRGIFCVPAGLMEPEIAGGWYIWQVNKAYLAARPLNGNASFVDIIPTDKTYRYLVSPGALTGWAVQLGEQPRYPTLADFKAAVLRNCDLDTSDFTPEKRLVSLRTLDGDVIKLHHTGGPGGRPQAWTNGTEISYENWPVFESPYMREDINTGG